MFDCDRWEFLVLVSLALGRALGLVFRALGLVGRVAELLDLAFLVLHVLRVREFC